MSRKKTSPQITSASKMHCEESGGCDQKLCFIFSLSMPLLGATVLAPASQRLAWGGHNPLSVGMANKMCCLLWATHQVYWDGIKPWQGEKGFGVFFGSQLHLSETFPWQLRTGKWNITGWTQPAVGKKPEQKVVSCNSSCQCGLFAPRWLPPALDLPAT